MAMEKEAVESRGRRKQVRKILEFDGQLIFEPQWYSRTYKEENKRYND